MREDHLPKTAGGRKAMEGLYERVRRKGLDINNSQKREDRCLYRNQKAMMRWGSRQLTVRPGHRLYTLTNQPITCLFAYTFWGVGSFTKLEAKVPS